MEQTLDLQGYTIKVQLDEHAVHITNDDSLVQLLNTGKEAAVDALVQMIKEQFRQLYRWDLDISDNSLAVEIWGHVYCGHLAQALDNLVQLKLIEKLMDKVISYCAVIDCGEAGHDHNRMFWDLLAPFKSRIAAWLPEDMR